MMVTTRSRHKLIVRGSLIHGGEPIIRGTRIPVRSIVLSLQDDYAGELRSVAKAYDVSPAVAEAALAYYRSHQVEIDHIIDENERA
jgi:uncharacterized protein (DUF433 family)